MIGFFLDLALTIGWSLWTGPADRAPQFGSHKLDPWRHAEDNDFGLRLLQLRVWEREMIRKHRPGVIGFEMPWIPFGARGEGARGFDMRTVRMQLLLAGEVETTAKECGVPRILEVASSSAKIALAGTSRMGKNKGAMMNSAALDRGWNVAGARGDQADAGAVGLVSYQSLGFDIE